jgi:hypothetical protein
MKIWALRLAVFALFAIGLLFAANSASAQTTPGVIKAGKVDGAEVTRLTADGQSLPLRNGDMLIETDTIVTGRGSSVVLVFANGSSVRVGSDSKLNIEQFKMDPLGEEIAVGKLTNEPSVSQTELRLDYGEMVGDVKKLNTASNFNIRTPVGAAGIRGTQFRIVFRPTGDGRAFNFQISTAEGLVVFEGTTPGGSSALPVADQQEIVITAQVDPNTGQITGLSVPANTTPISPEAAAQILTAVVTEIAPAIQQTVITTNEQQQQATQQTNVNPSPPASDPPPNPSTSDNSQSPSTPSASTNPSNPNPNPTQTPTTPPPNTPRGPQLTPGAGG